ncbi:MAG: hypothetical protein JXR95_07665 [Deltaproteobacteria bacterium]|nr:hypothetical protein [Deltaproteobacteria bacterium]
MKSFFAVLVLVWFIPLVVDANQTWERVFDQEGDDNQILALNVLDESTAWFIAADSSSGNTQLKGYKTTNGSSFSQMFLPTSAGMVMFLDLSFVDSNTGYLTGMDIDMPFKDLFDLETYVVWKTTNGGASWEILDDTLEELITKVQAFSTGELFGISENNFYIFNGTTFSTGELPEFTGNINTLQMITNQIGFIGGGISWDEENPSQQPGSGFVMITEDGGQSFRTVSSNLNFNVTSVYFLNSDYGWIGGYDANQAYIYATEDGGQTWISQSLPQHPGFDVEIELPFKFTQTVEPATITGIAGIRFFDCERGVALGVCCISDCVPSTEETDPSYVTMFLRTYDAGETWEMDQHYEEVMNNWGTMMAGAKIMSMLNVMGFPTPNKGFIGGEQMMLLSYSALEPEEVSPDGVIECDGSGTENNNNNNNTDDPFSEPSDSGCGCSTPGQTGFVPVFSIFLFGMLILLRRKIL